MKAQSEVIADLLLKEFKRRDIECHIACAAMASAILDMFFECDQSEIAVADFCKVMADCYAARISSED